jgi:hypothetical protein
MRKAAKFILKSIGKKQGSDVKVVETSPDITGSAEPNSLNAAYADAEVLSKAVR